MSNEKLEAILSEATQLLGSDIHGNLPLPLYDFMRRYGPMLCVDIALIPEGDQHSILLLKRGQNAVAPGEYWIAGGRVDKHMDAIATAQNKIRSEISIDAVLTIHDFIGLGATRFPPNKDEKILRNYDVVTSNICYACRIPQAEFESKLKAGDGNMDWKVFTEIDPLWDLYVIHATASAWDRFFGKKWRESVNIEVKRKLEDHSAFIPLKYVSS